MRVEVELWQVFSTLTTIVVAFWGIAKMLMAANQRAIDEKFTAVTTGLAKQDDTNRRLERDLMELKAELPRDYVRREDYTAAIATVTSKIDHLGFRMEQAIREAYSTSAGNQTKKGSGQ